MSVLLVCLPAERMADSQLAQLQSAAPDMRVVRTTERAAIEGLLDEVEIAVSFPHDLLARAPRLRWVQEWGAGVDWLLQHPEVAELDFTLTNASGVHAIPISEQILAYLLAFARGLPAAVRAQARHAWQPAKREQLFELAGKTMLLVGVGAIGERTAVIAAALGMRVLGIRRNPAGDLPGVEAIYGPDRLYDLLPEADCVVLTVPLSHATQGMIGERELRAMKPTSYLINIGRGGTIQQPALIQALSEGWIAGAGLDVFDQEPLPATSPLWELDNVIMTAHYAGLTPAYDQRALAIFLDNLKRYRDGEPLKNVVDKAAGY
ncbi:MAG: D-2-hydroxyacid dehydrogenase [Chloroflexota bacterium]|nr:D-2-hydroxyacid dehydrogenase [Chloroflexota bacterium]